MKFKIVIETKFNIGDEVFRYNRDGKLEKIVIDTIVLRHIGKAGHYWEDGETHQYRAGQFTYSEKELHASPEAFLKSILLAE